LLRLTEDIASLFEQGGTLVVPSRSRARAVRLAHAAAALAAGRQVWASPDVLSLGGWLRREAERLGAQDTAGAERILSAAEEWLLWRQCAAEVAQGLPLLDVAALGESLQRSSARAGDYGITLSARVGDGETALLVRAEREFAARCQALGACSVSALTGNILSAPRRAGALLLRGFDALPARLAQLAGIARPEQVGTASVATASSRLVIPTDDRAELERIAGWCATRVGAQPDARLLVLLPGAAGARQRLATLVRQALDAHGSVATAAGTACPAGVDDAAPLAQQPPVRQALTTLAWLDGAEGEVLHWCEWLRSPHWRAPAAPARAHLAARLRERAPAVLGLRELLGGLQIMPPDLQGAGRELAAQLTRAAALWREGRASPRLWAERCRDALRATGWPGEAAETLAREPLARWHELLESFGQLTPSLPLMTRSEAVRLLRDLAARMPLHGADEDVTVSISATLADPVVHYDGIWVAGLTADVLPQPVSPDPFLPPASQRATGVPEATAAGRLAQARTRLQAWCALAGELVLSVPARAADLELLPSPLLAQPGREPHAGPGTTSLPWLAARLHRDDQLEWFTDERGLRWNAARPLPRGTSSLDLQNTCPFKAYAELRLGALRPEVPEPGVAAHLRGQLLHGALERLWAQLRDSRALGRLAGESLAALIAQCVRDAAHALFEPQERRRRRPVPSGQLDLFREIPRALARDCRRAERLIGELCELDRARAPFRVGGTELSLDLQLAGGRLRMRLDRIDELETGGRVVLDYKTGMHRPADWYGERPTYPQLLAYLSAVGEDVAALATVWLSVRELRFDGVSRAPGMLPGVRPARGAGTTPEEVWERQRRAWQAVLERLIRDFLEGDAALDPKPGACRGCHVSGICRIRERTAGAGERSEVEGADE
jgi:probable DNA repair protein